MTGQAGPDSNSSKEDEIQEMSSDEDKPKGAPEQQSESHLGTEGSVAIDKMEKAEELGNKATTSTRGMELWIEGSRLHRVARRLDEIAQSPILKKALKHATSEATTSRSRIEELMSRSDKMKTVIFEVVGFYLVFQGVMITVVAQSTVLRLGNVWCPVWCPMLLSFAAAVSCSIPLCKKGCSIAHIRENIRDEEKDYEVARDWITQLRYRSTGDGAFEEIVQRPRTGSRKFSTFSSFKPYFLILVFIIVFEVLILISMWRIKS